MGPHFPFLSGGFGASIGNELIHSVAGCLGVQLDHSLYLCKHRGDWPDAEFAFLQLRDHHATVFQSERLSLLRREY